MMIPFSQMDAGRIQGMTDGQREGADQNGPPLMCLQAMEKTNNLADTAYGLMV